MKTNSWMRYSKKQGSELGSYLSLSRFPTFESQTDDFIVEVVKGDRPELLAARYYGDRRLFWVVMVRNRLSDPIVDLAPGMSITLPSLRYVQERMVAK